MHRRYKRCSISFDNKKNILVIKLERLKDSKCHFKTLKYKNNSELFDKIKLYKNLTNFTIACDMKYIPKELYDIINMKCLMIQNREKDMEIHENLKYLISRYNDITTLILDRVNINQVSEEIYGMTQLKYLTITGCNIKQINSSIAKLINLEGINLSNNKLEFIDPAIGQLVKLSYLNLSYNRLKYIDPVIYNLTKLERLEFKSNQIEYLDPLIGQLTELEYLEVENNKIKNFPEEVYNLSKLVRLSIYNNCITRIEKGFHKLVNLGTFELTGNNFKFVSYDVIRNKKMTRYSFCHCNVLDELDDETRGKICDILDMVQPVNEIRMVRWQLFRYIECEKPFKNELIYDINKMYGMNIDLHYFKSLSFKDQCYYIINLFSPDIKIALK
jgi:hypothetical protein